MKLIPAKERFRKIEFSNYDDWDEHPISIYECPFCKSQLSLNFKDLRRHSLSEHTNLDKSLTNEMSEYSSKRDQDSNSFLDFHCTGCNRPVRINYQAWAGGRHGEAGFILQSVVEAEV